MRRLPSFLFIALLLSTIPAQASSLVLRQTGDDGLSVNQYAAGSNRHRVSSTEYQWEPDVDRAIDRVFKPPRGISLIVTQSREDVRDRFGPDYKPNSTLGTVELKVHW